MDESFVDPFENDGNGKDDLDDILGIGNSEHIEPTKTKESSETKVETVLPTANLPDTEDEIPSLNGDNFPHDYSKMADRIRSHYRLLPKLDYDSIYREISELSVKSCPTPTLQVLNDEIQKVQAAKDRLSDIFVEVIKVYNYKKRAVDILHDSWGKFTSEKNAEARKGDATFRLCNFELDLAEAEALLKAVTHIFRNLDSFHDTLSRRITICQVTMKLHDFGRTALPDYNFDKVSLSEKISSNIFPEDETSKNKEDVSVPKLEGF